MLGNRAQIKIPSDLDNQKLPYLSECTGLLDADGVIIDTSGVLVDVIVYTDGVNAATVIIYDNASAASGKVLAKVIVAGAENFGGEVSIFTGVENGLYLDISGTGAKALVRYISIAT